jgi:hypothetical protein
MKFDNLYRLVVNSSVLNEGSPSEDLKELNQDGAASGIPTQVSPDEGFTSPTARKDPRAMNHEEKIQYLMQYSRILNKNPNWTDNDKRAKAEYLVNNDLFDAFIDPIEARFEAEQEEDPNADITAGADGLEDIGDIKSSFRADRELRQREMEDEEEAMHGRD